jgi:antitoxin ParD1/3/4
VPTRNVVLTERQAAMIERLVDSGEYQNASEVLRDGLRLLERRQAEDAAKLDALRQAAQIGLDDIAAGRYQDFHTPEELGEFLAELTQRVIAGRRG